MKEMITDLTSGVFELLGEIIKIGGKFLLRAFDVLLWIICGLIILPCVFVAGNLYPAWLKWQGLDD